MIRSVVFLSSLFAGFTAVATPIHDGNWLNHPEVLKIRALYAEINAAEKSQLLKPESTGCTLHRGALKIDATLYRDLNRMIRKYVVKAGTGDSVGVAEYYYDKDGVPRFTYKTRSVYNGTKQQDRIYFNASGAHLYTNHKQEGAGYPQGGLDDVVRSPSVDYAQICEE